MGFAAALNPSYGLLPFLTAYQNDLPNEELAGTAGYTHNNGGFNNPKRRLCTFVLSEYPIAGRVRATDILFPQSLR